MWFALSYLFFFTIDILVESEFYVFGMMPYTALVTAVSIYTFLILRHMRSWIRTRGQLLVVQLWLGFMIAVSVFHLFSSTGYIWNSWISAERSFLISDISNKVFFLWGFFLLLSSCRLLKPFSKIHPWLISAALAIMFNFGIYWVIDPVPELLYRYEGFLGLPMLFCWLMIDIIILRKKYDPDCKTVQA